jgi:hypothetical protein
VGSKYVLVPPAAAQGRGSESITLDELAIRRLSTFAVRAFTLGHNLLPALVDDEIAADGEKAIRLSLANRATRVITQLDLGRNLATLQR